MARVPLEDLSPFSRRGGFERLSLGMATVEIGLERPFSVLHVSDTHLSAADDDEPPEKQILSLKRTRCFGGRQEEALRDSVLWAREHVDLVVHTGDIIDWQSRANFALVRKYAGLCPGGRMVGCSGNHEFSQSMWLGTPKETPTEANKDISRETLRAELPFDPFFQASVFGGVNFVAMDNAYGTFKPDQIERFWAERDKGLPIVLCVHVPIHDADSWRMARHFWNWRRPKFADAAVPPADGVFGAQLEDRATAAFLRALRREPLLKAVLCGHEHVGMQIPFSPTATEFAVAGNFLFAGEEILFV